MEGSEEDERAYSGEAIEQTQIDDKPKKVQGFIHSSNANGQMRDAETAG